MSGAAFPAPAKLNLFLHVLGRRPDGYHRLQTVFTFIDRADTLFVDVRRDRRIARSGEIPGVPEEADLCVRAARALQAASGCVLGADLRLEKRIPMGGGLGGGSSDAATCLLALDSLWRLDMPRGELARIGLALGADVPVFVEGRSAFADGVGEELTPVEVPSAWYVVLTPAVAVSTAAVFGYPDIPRDTRPIRVGDWRPGFGRNDLQAAVAARFPEVAAALDWLGGYGDARMTGSGACVFAAFPDKAAADRVFSSRPPDIEGFVAPGLNGHPLLQRR